MRDHYKGYRLPKSVIGFAVRYYYRYKISLRDLSEMLEDRGLSVTYEIIRNWCQTWSPVYARGIRQKRGSPFKDKWHIDEVRVKIKGDVFWLWRLIDSEEEEIDVLLQRRKNAKSAIRFLKRALKKLGMFPRVMVTDKLRSYIKAHRVFTQTC
ncbi:IS6 family transposase [Candidatus Odyssella acanthamoebae]|uniref:IS6 family transposase n=1 Tax=Candidatus Odyssella acanthamoebae TaxID=91604 RepID=UPI0006925908|nr:IS6 family transposase [Candidatus Paracaedibacter acanthamoebae]